MLILTDSVDIDFNPVHDIASIQNPATFLHPNRKNKTDAGILMTLTDVRRTQLETDLLRELKIKRLAYLVISGDIANRSTKEE